MKKILRKLFSTDFLATIGIVYGLIHYQKDIPILWLTIFVNGVLGSYVLGRLMSKKNKGQFYTGFLTREFYAILFAIRFDWYAMNQGLSSLLGWGFIIGAVILYNITRGLIHGVGVRTQFI